MVPVMSTIIICPACGTRYEIGGAIPPEGRKVRCSKCSHIWQARPAPPEPSIAIVQPQRPQARPAPAFAPVNPAMRGFAGIPQAPQQKRGFPPPPQEPSFTSAHEEAAVPPHEEDHFAAPHEEPAPIAPQPESSSYPSFSASIADRQAASDQLDAEFDTGDEADLASGGDAAMAGGAEGALSPEMAAGTESSMFSDWDSGVLAQPPVATETAANPQIVIPTAAPPRPKSGRAVAIGWGLLLLFVLSVAGLVALAPKTVVSMLPGATRLYAMLGMPVNLRGLALEGVSYGWSRDGEETVLEVKGEIVNLTAAALQIPIVVIALRDEKGAEISQWTTTAGDEPLAPGARTPFTADIASPPDTVRSLKVRFARPK
jgi:predicted Zn finger-like uncharacterized protein